MTDAGESTTAGGISGMKDAAERNWERERERERERSIPNAFVIFRITRFLYYPQQLNVKPSHSL